MKKIAFIDVDQTLTNSYWLISLVRKLVKKDLILKTYADKILKQFEKYHKRKNKKPTNLDSYNYTAQTTTESFSRGLRGKDKNKVIEVAKKLFNKTLDKKLYPYTKKLIKYLKKNNYYIVFVSASPIEIIDQIKDYFKADDVCALVSEVENSIYTGRVAYNPGFPEKKAECLEMYKQKYIKQDPFIVVFGDSRGDEKMLDKADVAIIVNADYEMREISSKKNYYIIENNNKAVEKIAKLLKRK